MGESFTGMRADRIPLRERVLSAIARGAITSGELARRTNRHITPVLTALRSAGLIALDDHDGTYSITDAGRIALRTKDA